MFVIKKTREFLWPIELKFPKDGEFSTESIKLKFITLTNKEMGNLSAIGDGDDKSMCEKIIIGWEGVSDEEGNELKFSKKNLELLLDSNYGMSTQIAMQYLKVWREAVTKN